MYNVFYLQILPAYPTHLSPNLFIYFLKCIFTILWFQSVMLICSRLYTPWFMDNQSVWKNQSGSFSPNSQQLPVAPQQGVEIWELFLNHSLPWSCGNPETTTPVNHVYMIMPCPEDDIWQPSPLHTPVPMVFPGPLLQCFLSFGKHRVLIQTSHLQNSQLGITNSLDTNINASTLTTIHRSKKFFWSWREWYKSTEINM